MPYLGKSPSSGVRTRFVYAATSGQTSFSGNDSAGISLAYDDNLYMDVYQNGVLLKPVTDYAATTGTSVVLTTGATTDDVVEMIVYDTFAVADTVSAKDGGTFSGNMAMGGTLTLTGNADFNGDLDVDGTTNLDVVDIDGAVDMASTLQVDGAITSSAGATISSSSSGEFNAITISQANNTSGNESRIRFKRTTDAGSDREVAAIVADRVGGNDTALAFEVNTDGADGAVEKARLKHDGTFLLGATSVTASGSPVLETIGAISAIKNHTDTSSSGNVSSGNGNQALTLMNNQGGADDQTAKLGFSVTTTGATSDALIEFGSTAAGTGELRFYVESGNTINRRMTLNSSGALLIGKTADSIANNGISLAGSATGGGNLSVTNDGNACASFNRKTSDGTIMSFATDGTTGGSIGVLGDRLCVGQSDVALFFDATNNTITPFSFDTFDTIDDHIDLGISSRRFDDIFATNGTIQTSDENEKQNIAALTSAEITAAKAISKLFKTFKWKSKVTAKGNAARTHTGVVAQEVQAAMSAAGLDATKYAFWCSDTWWEKSTDVAAVEAADAVYEDVFIAAVEEKRDDDGQVLVQAEGEYTEKRLVSEAVEAKDAYTRTDTYHTESEAPEGATKHTRLGVRYPELLAFVGAATEQRLADIETRLAALEA